jgi:hypothetical protein
VCWLSSCPLLNLFLSSLVYWRIRPQVARPVFIYSVRNGQRVLSLDQEAFIQELNLMMSYIKKEGIEWQSPIDGRKMWPVHIRNIIQNGKVQSIKEKNGPLGVSCPTLCLQIFVLGFLRQITHFVPKRDI